MGLSALEQQLLQFLLLGNRQACRGVAFLGCKSVGFLYVLKPALGGTRRDAHNASDIPYFVALLNRLTRLASPLFQCAGRSRRSAHVRLYASRPPDRHSARSWR